MAIFNKRNSIYDEQDEFEPMTDTSVSSAPAVRAEAPKTMLQMKMIRPQRLVEATEVADSLKLGHTIVLNLEDLDDDTARRMLDYVAGVIYTVNGKIERPSERTFLLTPNGVSIDTEDR